MPSRAQTRKRADKDAKSKLIRANLGMRSLVLIGLMGAGKTAIGRRLAKQLNVGFVDADTEIERAAGKSISDFFADHGETHFRDGERKVIARLLKGGPQVLATGGGAYMDEQTRIAVAKHGISIWLKADLKILLERVGRRDHRPLLKTGDPKEVMKRLMDERYPVYESANITTVSRDVPHEVIVGEIIDALANCPALPADDGQKARG